MALGSLGLQFFGQEGLGRAGVGAAGVEAGAVAAAGARDAGVYTLIAFANPEAPLVSGGVRTGMWWRADGTKMFIARTFNNLRSYDVSPAFSITPGDWSNHVPVTASSVGRVQITPDGTRLLSLVNSGGSGLLSQTDMSSAFDITTLGSASFKVLGLQMQHAYWDPDNGLRLWTLLTGGTLQEHVASSAFSVSTVGAAIKTFDMSVDAGNVSQFILSRDGTRLYSVTSSNPFPIVSWRLATPFDISTAGNFSTGLTLNTELSNPIGPYFRPDNGDLFYCGSTKSGAAQQQFKVFSP